MEINTESKNKKRLGRGLDSLFGGAEIKVEAISPLSTQSAQNQTNVNKVKDDGSQNTENRIWNIAIDKLKPGQFQPRKNFDKETLSELANSIKENGIIQPISVRKEKSGGYEILAGERRWRAAQMAGLHEVPAIIKTITDREALQVALIENIQREDLDPIEEAESYQRLIEEFSLSQQEAADKVGKERSTVANAIRLLSLPFEIRDMLTKKQISVGHAKVIMSLTDRLKQIELSNKIIEKGMSVRSLELEIKGPTKNNKSSEADGVLNMDLAEKLALDLADQLQKIMGTKVQINYKSGKGNVQVFFYSDDQLTQIYEKLKE